MKILVVTNDDFSHDWIGAYHAILDPDGTWTADSNLTPNIDSLADNGVIFTNFYSMPNCSPTRAAMYTGRYGFRTGVRDLVPQVDTVGRLSLKELFLPGILARARRNDWGLGCIGKWHVSDRHAGWVDGPNLVGFNTFDAGLISSVPVGTDGTTDNTYWSWDEITNGAISAQTIYAQQRVKERFLTWKSSIEATQPNWLCVLNFPLPHSPFHGPDPAEHSQTLDQVGRVVVTAGGTGYTSDPTVSFSGGGGSGATATASTSGGAVTAVTITDNGTGYTSDPTVSFSGGGGSGAAATAYSWPANADLFRAMIQSMDYWWGELEGDWNGAGVPLDWTTEELIVIWLSDNGTTGTNGVVDTVLPPFTQDHAKGKIYNYGCNVPLIVRAGEPLGLQGGVGRVSEALVSATDIMPTVLDIAGLELQEAIPGSRPIDGISFLPAITGAKPGGNRKWLLVERGPDEGTISQETLHRGIYTKRFSLLRFGDDYEFYDLRADVTQDTELIANGMDEEQTLGYDKLTRQMEEVYEADADTPLDGTTLPG